MWQVVSAIALLQVIVLCKRQRRADLIASNILADRLRRLVAAGLLTREDVDRGRRATYSLTDARACLSSG